MFTRKRECVPPGSAGLLAFWQWLFNTMSGIISLQILSVPGYNGFNVACAIFYPARLAPAES